MQLTQPKPTDRELREDRRLGDLWERNFCRLGAEYGRVLTPNQISSPTHAASAWGAPIVNGIVSRYLLPDVVVWSAPGEHHEIKHKNPDRMGCYGLELYRLEALIKWAEVTRQRVYYTIHDWEAAGGKHVTSNCIDHWFTADISEIAGTTTRGGKAWSWRNGRLSLEEMRYWSVRRYFQPLSYLWVF